MDTCNQEKSDLHGHSRKVMPEFTKIYSLSRAPTRGQALCPELGTKL